MLVEQISAFIASPSDVEALREVVRRIFDSISRTFAKSYKCDFKLWDYSDVPAGIGRPQSLINRSIAGNSYALFMFWKKWGSATGREGFTSGTEEEFHECAELCRREHLRDLAVLFQVTSDDHRDPNLHQFRSRLISDKQYFF